MNPRSGRNSTSSSSPGNSTSTSAGSSPPTRSHRQPQGPRRLRQDRRVGVRLLRFRQVALHQDAVVLARQRGTHPRRRDQAGGRVLRDKIQDAMLFGDIKRAVASQHRRHPLQHRQQGRQPRRPGRHPGGVPQGPQRDAGLLPRPSPHRPHGAIPRRARASSQTFQDAFKQLTGSDWEDERDAYAVQPRSGGRGLLAATGQSKEAARSGSTVPKSTSP